MKASNGRVEPIQAKRFGRQSRLGLNLGVGLAEARIHAVGGDDEIGVEDCGSMGEIRTDIAP